MPDGASERAESGNDPSGDRMTPPRDTALSRSEIRLLRDTRRVLEYLSSQDGYFLVSDDVRSGDFQQSKTLMGQLTASRVFVCCVNTSDEDGI